ncbi:MAG TPA: MBL fold metallo-hydrolase, partial [Bacteroidota bacterium]|nr:MBL fold metallo-hydrolase [Bacteroidota bacterium]
MRQFSATIVAVLFFSLLSNAQEKKSESIQFIPIGHASFVIQSSAGTIYVDPVGEAKAYASIAPPDIILITDIHGDHLSSETVANLKKEKTTVVGPKAVTDKLGYGSA